MLGSSNKGVEQYVHIYTYILCLDSGVGFKEVSCDLATGKSVSVANE